MVEEVGEVGEVVAALARMKRRIGTSPALRVLVTFESYNFY